MFRFRSIIAAVDFSDAAADTLDAALALAGSTPEARIVLLHVVPDPVPALGTDELPALDLGAVERSWIQAAQRQLAALIAARAPGAPAVDPEVAVGAPAAAIVRSAERHAADAIVLGSHGHGIVRRFLLGTVADKVVRQAPCAVMVVPHRALARDAGPASAAAGAGAAS